MPHIHTEPNQHDLTVSAYIVRLYRKTPKILFHMHKKLNMLMPVGGHVELLENPWQAISHEISEESGYDLDQLDVLQPPSRIKKMTGVTQHPHPMALHTHGIPSEHFHTDIVYAFVANSSPRTKTNIGESTDLRWMSVDELDAISTDNIFENTREVCHFIVDEALLNWEKIPASSFEFKSAA